MIELDGNYGEGGGAIVRTALALSALTLKPFKVDKIRSNRPKPGLKPQHVHTIKQLRKITEAAVTGDELGSTELAFAPKHLKAKNLKIDIGTAGSITLLLQTLIPSLMFADKRCKLAIKGGTDVSWSPPVDYLREVLLPQFNRYAKISCKLIKRGYYPEGGGEIEISIVPSYSLEELKQAPKINLTEQGHLMQIKGISHASKQLIQAKVAERQAHAAKQLLAKEFSCPIHIRTEYCDSLSTGSGVFLYAIFSKTKDDVDINNPIRLGADCLGERGKRAEIVGQEAAQSLVDEIKSGAAADHYLADQLLLLMALIGDCRIKTSNVSSHAKTNIYVIEQFLGRKFEVDENVIST